MHKDIENVVKTQIIAENKCNSCDRSFATFRGLRIHFTARHIKTSNSQYKQVECVMSLKNISLSFITYYLMVLILIFKLHLFRLLYQNSLVFEL